MTRALPVCAVLLALPLVCRADETVIHLRVWRALAPKPALRYQLLPELREMNPGNPILGYLKCFMGQNHFFYSKEAEEKRSKWLEMPLMDLPLEELRNYGGVALRQADYAARLDNPDWQILLRIRREGMNLVVPEFQPLRQLAMTLVVRHRAEIAARRFDDALVTAKTMFALSRHLGEHPTLIGDLVGLAIAVQATGRLEEMIQQPGCPNLYWALTDLPNPLIDFRRGLQGERMFLANEFSMLDEHASMSAGQLKKAVDEIHELLENAFGGLGRPKQDVREWLAAQAGNEVHVRAARQRLVEYGLVGDRVRQFPALQVILLDEKLTCEVRRDDAMKAMTLPYREAGPLLAASQPANGDAEQSPFAWIVPAVGLVRQAQARLQQRIGLLRCVEALRMYAAEHGGRLPARLEDIKVPQPVDPITGRPFVYRLEGVTATFRGTPPPGKERIPFYSGPFEVTIAK